MDLQTMQLITVIATIIMAVVIGLQAWYTRRAVEESRRSNAIQLLAALRGDITASLLSLKFASWILKSLGDHESCKSDPDRCVSIANNALTSNYRCTKPAGMLNNYKIPLESRGFIGELPSVKESLLLLRRLAKDVAGDRGLEKEISGMLSLYNEERAKFAIKCTQLKEIADKLDNIIHRAETTLNAPIPEIVFKRCREKQGAPQC